MASSYKSAELSRHLTQDVDIATDIITIAVTINVTISGINNVITTKISIQVNIATAATLYERQCKAVNRRNCYAFEWLSAKNQQPTVLPCWQTD